MSNIDFEEYMNQGKLLLGQEKYNEAIVFFEKAEALDNLCIDVYVYKGICFANLDKTEDAKNEFVKALKINKKEGIVYFHLGNIEILQGNKAKGIEYYNNAIANGFDDAQVYFSLGLMNEEEGNVDIALRNYSKAILKDSNRPDIRIRKARLLIVNKMLAEAVQCLDELILSNPDVFEGYHLKNLVLIEMGKYEEAETVLNNAISLFPKDPAFAIDIASLEIYKKNYNDALFKFSEIEKSYELEIEHYHTIAMEKARVYSYLENMQDTIKELNSAKEYALKFDPPMLDLEAIYLLMNCYLNVEDYDNVINMAQQIKKASGEEYYQLAAYYYEPLALKKKNQIDNANKLFEEAVAHYRTISLGAPNNVDSYAFRIMSLRELGKLEKALELSDFLVNVNENVAEAHVLRAIVLDDLGRSEEAQSERNKAQAIGTAIVQFD